MSEGKRNNSYIRVSYYGSIRKVVKTTFWMSYIKNSLIQMAAFQFTSFNLQMAQDYFSNLSPLAQRIASDINITKSSYGTLWYTMKENQQNEIINQTLINPEISLKYLENLFLPASSLSPSSSSSSSSSASLCTTSAEHILPSSSKNRGQDYFPNVNSKTSRSLTENILQTQNLLSKTLVARAKHTVTSHTHQLGKLKPPSSPPPPPPTRSKKLKRTENTEKQKSYLRSLQTLRNDPANGRNEKTDYIYDGVNLHTYIAQKVALKIIYDDVLRAYPNEHSQPFSYRTKSQIDLQQQYYEADLNDINLNTNFDYKCLTSNESCNINLVKNVDLTKNYDSLQKELKSTLSNHLKPFRKNKRLLPISQEVSNNPSAKAIQVLSSPNLNKSKNESSRCLKENFVKHTSEGSFLLDFKPKQSNLNYAVYADVYVEKGESATLVYNCSNSGILTGSSNSLTTTSDDDAQSNHEYNDENGDEKTLCRLLDNDLNLHRGFDFLNNW
ncbi:uncharacterized protein LOC126765682 isoform X1 [Bactrocera neohumeralis]|uniref:uncharacterized protein LOC126765682 isoform X1 n=2 Tax=Bactrocera neohumeralis TaxID=98809 RepID=UPI002165118F|nr:uncharacterized protein LOC126765682 isoform X1 [Bactrocera neohumeralis]XP_050339351.1 uncharacterized protein LOC126765682 isoform X1 [Bactrocera neohumeralis]XP_050339352.1 uncharacterized protein LOC126765682 isoform X1 [Bactrocera neohumeralis]XP_050339353.1 uncharacterized protein LOC126765682 isoform X1 [Bactrocera neohumeralis]XP_050339354.1 uncharacterized protein LOC126765682 isoform X1 [Bactrocera neohumeralis]